jgi:hypothetical protein
MTKRKDQMPGYGKILDAWIPPDDAGEPVGCLATSFTFSPVFFEEECLGRFLQLGTNATEDGPAYLIEREEKLSQLECAAALVDQNHARGVRSLRWDLLSARVPRGILHSKVSLLLWSRCARLLVASSNLTEDGYRRNHEVFGALDYFNGSEASLAALDEIISFLADAVRYTDPATRSQSAAVRRWNAFLTNVSKATRSWGIGNSPSTIAKLRAFAVVTGPGRPDALRVLKSLWPESVPPDSAFVVSPFFDPPAATNAPARALWAMLKQRGSATVEFDVTAEDVPGKKAILLHAPQSLLAAQPASRGQTDTVMKRLVLEDARPLHAKSLWLQSDRVVLSMIGSSNFTSAGLGIGRTQNLEANLAYAVSQQSKVAAKSLNDAWLPAEDIPDELEIRWMPCPDDGEDSATAGTVLLPPFFGEASFGRDEKLEAFVELTFNDAPPKAWAIFIEDEAEPFFVEASWVSANRAASIRLQWDRERPPSGLSVSWKGSGGSAWWPVNVLTAASLPPPAELKDLPLEVLIEILTSAKPLHQALERWLRRQKESGSRDGGISLDPHKRVDTSSFLLQRTRRVSDALTGLRKKLEQPLVSEQAMEWRLRGPVGVLALAQAVSKEARSEQERCFLLTELCLELARVRPKVSLGGLSAAHIRKGIRELSREIRSTISADAMIGLPALAAYTEAAFEEIGQ